MSDSIQTIHYNRDEDDSLSHFHPHAPSTGPVRFCDASGICSEDWVDGTVTSVTNAPSGWLVRVVPNEDHWPDEAPYTLFVEERSETSDLRDWDIDRLVFYVGELESTVSRLATEISKWEDDVVVALTAEQAFTLCCSLSDDIDAMTKRGGDPWLETLTEIHDTIVGALPKEDEAP